MQAPVLYVLERIHARRSAGFNSCSKEENGGRTVKVHIFLNFLKYILKPDVIRLLVVIINMHPFKHSINVLSRIYILLLKVHKYEKKVLK